MDHADEIRDLRDRLQSLLAQADALSRRIDALEHSEQPSKPAPIPRAETPKPPPVIAPTPKPATPPPRPPVPTPKPPRSALPPAKPFDMADTWVGRLVRQRIDEMRKTTAELGWELSLGTYWIPRVAIVLIAVAVTLLLSLAVQRWGSEWGPYFRVGVGYAVCIGLLGLAWRVEKRVPPFARVLYAGGMAISYLVTFSTYYVPFAQIFSSAAPTLVLLAVVVVLWAVAAQVRQSRVIAVLVTALGHFTILMATLSFHGVSLYSVAGILALSVGSAFFLLRNRWYYVAALGIVGSYVNHFIILIKSPGTDRPVDFAMAMGVLTAYLLVFALSELLSPDAVRRREVPTWFRNAFVTLNTAAFFVLGSITMSAFSFARHHQDAFRFCLAVVLILIALGYLRLRKGDPLYSIYLTKGVVAFTLGLAARYNSSALSAWLAVETVVLLLAARRSQLLITRVLALLLGVVAFLHGAHSVYTGGAVPYASPDYLARLAEALLFVAAFLVASQIYQRTDWTRSVPRWAPKSPSLHEMLWKLDLTPVTPDTSAPLAKPLGGLLHPYLYALAAGLFVLGYAQALTATEHLFPTLAAAAVLLTFAAALLGSAPFGAASLLPVSMGLVHATRQLLTAPLGPAWAVITGVCLLFLVALTSEKRFVPSTKGLSFHRHPAMPYVLYAIPAFVLGLFFLREYGVFSDTLILCAAAVAAGALIWILHPWALAIVSAAFLVWAAAHYGVTLVLRGEPVSDLARIAVAVIVVLSLLGDRYYRWRRMAALGAVLIVSACLVTLTYTLNEVRDAWAPAWVAAVAYGLLLYAVVFRTKTAGVMATISAWVALILLLDWRYPKDVAQIPALTVGFGAGALFWLVGERISAYARYPREDAQRRKIALLLVGIAAAALLVLLKRIPDFSDIDRAYVTLGWFGLSVALLVISLPFRCKEYRYIALAVIALSVGRVFLVDLRGAEAMLRIAAFAVLGIGLLAIAFGYFKWLERVRRNGPRVEP